MIRKAQSLYLLIILAFVSCTQPQVGMRDTIAGLEEELRIDTSTVINRPKTENLISLYLEYVAEFPDDTTSPSYLFRAAELSVAIGKYSDALAHFSQVMRYKNSPKAGDALFLQGFVTENYLQDPDEARELYQRFVRAFPNHPLADDAQVLINQLGMAPEELIRMFEQQNDSQQHSHPHEHAEGQ
ncbi:MAG: tetratricopeptide repeat protein [Bacteroidota bacterium]